MPRFTPRLISQRNLAITALVILIAILVASPALFRDIFGDWISAFESFSEERPILASGVFAGLSAASVILGPFSSAPTVPFAVAAWGELITLVLLLTGWTAGGIVAYALGLWIGEPLVARIVGQKRLEDWLAKIKPRLNFFTLFLFRLAMPSETGYIFGLIRYRFDLYLLLTFLAELLFALILIYGSSALLTASSGTIALAAIAWAALVGVALWLFMRRVK